jgi:IS30 family transposase
MSKFFTYEERLELQKYLKESLSFKEISRRLDKNPTTISREIRKYSSELLQDFQVSLSMHAKTASTVETKCMR